MTLSKRVVVVRFNGEVVGYHTGKFRTTSGVTVPVVTKDPRLAKGYGSRSYGFQHGDPAQAIVDHSQHTLSAGFTTIYYEGDDER